GAGVRAATRPATTPSAISSRRPASRSNTPPNWKKWISTRTSTRCMHRRRAPWTCGASAPADRRPCRPPRRICACSSRHRSEAMALFEYFPNYVWNLSVAMALESGGKIGEIEDMCRPLREAAARGADAGTGEFMQRWVEVAERLIGRADEDAAAGRGFSASAKLERAALYLLVAERMQAQGSPAREDTYARAREMFDRSTALGSLPRERVEIPLARGHMPALYTRAPGSGRRPVVIYCNGLDSCKELLWWSRLPEALAQRGVSTLCVDQPGSGEALRLQQLPV